MKWLWIFLSMAVALGPVMWMMPSPQQKRIARLRTHAQNLGLEVKIAAMPQLHRAQVRQESPTMGVLYRLRFPPNYANKHPVTDWRVCRDVTVGTWDEEGFGKVPQSQQTILQNILAHLPADIFAFEQTVMGVAVYWCEREDVVDDLFFHLQQLNAVSA